MWNMNAMDDFSKQWEKMVKDWFDELMNNPDFLKNMSKSMEGALTSKSMLDEIKNNIAKSLSIPTASSIAKISQYIIKQEAKINDLEDLLYEQKNDIKELKELFIKSLDNKKSKNVKKTPSKTKKTVKEKK
ncbi:MAG: hypothetical protein M0R46_12255 [Candidatus Muirbacterium halophilum]|nr:hypothetical protein [Candidatus Muirbacterium halophilum]MCK9476689.1 hypothetical protein [Candidatus Muirbacterium halophilum]